MKKKRSDAYTDERAPIHAHRRTAGAYRRARRSSIAHMIAKRRIGEKVSYRHYEKIRHGEYKNAYTHRRRALSAVRLRAILIVLAAIEPKSDVFDMQTTMHGSEEKRCATGSDALRRPNGRQREREPGPTDRTAGRECEWQTETGQNGSVSFSA